jgi:hypothetical protein
VAVALWVPETLLTALTSSFVTAGSESAVVVLVPAVEPVVAAIGCRYSQSLRLKTT